jgi:hypothetical protein
MKNYEIKHVSYYEPGNKIWGWMTPTADSKIKNYEQVAYAFWAVVGKTVSLNKHTGWKPAIQMTQLEKKKADNKYVQLTEEQITAMWPDLHDAIEQRMLFMTLSDGFDK